MTNYVKIFDKPNHDLIIPEKLSGLVYLATYRNSGRRYAIPGNRAVIHAIDTL